MSADLWYYAVDEETKGPLDFADLIEVLRRSPRSQDVLVWRQGMKDWVKAETVSALSQHIVRPPPLPSKRLSPPVSPEPGPLIEEKGGKGWGRTAISILFGIVGVGLGRAYGSAFWIPALLVSLSYLGFSKLRIAPAVAAMLGVLVGHTLWMIVGHAALFMMGKPNPDWALLSVDVLAVLGLTIWCMKKQSRASCVGTLVYQLLCLVFLIGSFDDVTASVGQVGLIEHLILRIVGFGLALYAAVKQGRCAEVSVGYSAG